MPLYPLLLQERLSVTLPEELRGMEAKERLSLEATKPQGASRHSLAV